MVARQEVDERKALLRDARDRHLADVRKSLRRGSKTIRNSKREIQRSRDIMDKADDDAKT
jgi:hypothetical protein